MINHRYNSTRVTEVDAMPAAHAVGVSPTHRSRYQARGREISMHRGLGGEQWCAAFALSAFRLEVRGRGNDGDDADDAFFISRRTSGFGES